MKRLLASLLGLVILFQCNMVFAENSVETPIILCCENDVYSVDYVFSVTGDATITSVLVNDKNCMYDWNYVKSEAKLYISLASAQPLQKCKELIRVVYDSEIVLTPVSVKTNGMFAELSCLKHTEVDMPKVNPTYDKSGKEGGKICDVCKIVLKEHDTEIPALGPQITAKLSSDGVLSISGALTDNTSLDGEVILAIYSNGSLVNFCDISSLNQNAINIDIENISNADTVKIFQWSDITSMIPLNGAVIAQVNN